jgi:hypothetical protein
MLKKMNLIWNLMMDKELEKESERERLRIKSIAYGQTFNTGNYESTRILVDADILDEQSPDEVLQLLREWVRSRQLAESKQLQREREQHRLLQIALDKIESKRGDMVRAIRSAKECWDDAMVRVDQLNAILLANGLESVSLPCAAPDFSEPLLRVDPDVGDYAEDLEDVF